MPEPRQFSSEDVIDALRQRDKDARPVMTASDIADEVDCSRPIATRRLEELNESGEVQVAEVGGSRVWWLADEAVAESRVVREHDEDTLREVAKFLDDVDPANLEELKEADESLQKMTPTQFRRALQEVEREVKYTKWEHRTISFASSIIRYGILGAILGGAVLFYQAAVIEYGIGPSVPNYSTVTALFLVMGIWVIFVGGFIYGIAYLKSLWREQTLEVTNLVRRIKNKILNRPPS